MEIETKREKEFEIIETDDQVMTNITAKDMFRVVNIHWTYILGEFIDNSIDSVPQDELKNLEIHLNFDRDINDRQHFTIVDNGSGMTEDSFKKSLHKKRQKETDGKQKGHYGYGMKSSLMTMSNNFTIYTKSLNNNVYSFSFELTDKNKDDKWGKNIKKLDSSSWEIPHGTMIVSRFIEETYPSNKKDFDLLIKSIAARYAIDIEENGLKIYYKKAEKTSNNNYKKIETIKTHAFKVSQLEKAFPITNKNALKNDIIKIFDERKKQVRYDYEKIFGDSDIKEMIENDKPFNFKFITKINSKDVVVNWGVLALKEARVNECDYTDLTGMELIESNRAIYHGPNVIGGCNKFKFDFDKRNVSGGKTTFIRLFGSIDLTGVVKPDKNKGEFQWIDDKTSYNSKSDLENNVIIKIREVMVNILNALKKIEKNAKDGYYDTIGNLNTIENNEINCLNTNVEVSKNDNKHIDSNTNKTMNTAEKLESPHQPVEFHDIIRELNLMKDNQKLRFILEETEDTREFYSVVVHDESEIRTTIFNNDASLKVETLSFLSLIEMSKDRKAIKISPIIREFAKILNNNGALKAYKFFESIQK